MNMVTDQQAADALKILQEYVQQQELKITTIRQEINKFKRLKKEHTLDEMADLLNVAGYNALVVYKKEYGLDFSSLSAKKLLKINGVGPKTIKHINEVIGLFGYSLNP